MGQKSLLEVSFRLSVKTELPGVGIVPPSFGVYCDNEFFWGECRGFPQRPPKNEPSESLQDNDKGKWQLEHIVLTHLVEYSWQSG